MREFACIVETEHGIWLEPLITDSCIGCTNSSCEKRGKAFIVSKVTLTSKSFVTK